MTTENTHETLAQRPGAAPGPLNKRGTPDNRWYFGGAPGQYGVVLRFADDPPAAGKQAQQAVISRGDAQWEVAPDILGNGRQGPAVDIGAIEAQMPGQRRAAAALPGRHRTRHVESNADGN
ncbi:MAG: hypothetical protein JXR37_32045 [Kiritimatiellae bacterium]|nr:hypothetical protein [Kiritimatiellia bacterium]